METVERGSPAHWHSLGNNPARLPRTLKERLLASSASGIAVAVFLSGIWKAA